MPNYEIHPVEHIQGGRTSPYEMYHLSKAQWVKATQEAGPEKEGVAPANVMQHMRYVDPPYDSTSPGEDGMRALDGEYFYIYTAGKWKRFELSST